MEVIIHELASGKDAVLSQVLSLWGKICEQKYAFIQNESGIRDGQLYPACGRPKSLDLNMASNLDFQGQLEEVLQLRAMLSTEVEALQQIRAELEDSQSMSEVHLQLERATLENRRFQSALKVAHEQISELYFNKRVLEAEMEALRTDHERKLAEANERIRTAERAVVAVTSSCLFNKSSNADQTLDKHTKPVEEPKSVAIQDSFAKANPPKRALTAGSRFKQYATLNFDEFDSLDEDEEESPLNDNQAKQNDAFFPGGESRIPAAVTTHPSETIDSTVATTGDRDDLPEAILSPASSSTPRKVTDSQQTSPFPNVPNLLLKDASTDWRTPILRVDSESVPKADYLRLLDELDDLRQEVETLRSAQEVANKNPTPTHPTESKREDPGLTEQIQELADKVQQLTPESVHERRESLLPPVTQGATRLFDWSISPNQTGSSNESSSNLANSVQQENDEEQDDGETPVRQMPTPQCSRCLELQAELIASEALSCAKLLESSRVADEKIVAQECDLRQLRKSLNELKDRPFVNEISVQTDAEPSSSVDAKRIVGSELAPSSQTQTEPTDSEESLSVVVERYAKLTTDAACICLALSQRISALNRRSEHDSTPNQPDAFNLILNELCLEPAENGTDVTRNVYGAGYKMLAPALTQLNQEVEYLASVLDSELEHGSKRELFSEAAKIVEAERLQLQTELERRMVMFEQNHTSSIMELESSRRALIDQLATSEEANRQLKDQVTVLQQKLQAKERFLAEQIEERELEREEFRVDLDRLKEQLRVTKCELLSSKLVSGSSTAANSLDVDASDSSDFTHPRESRRHTMGELWGDRLHSPQHHHPLNWSHLCDSFGHSSLPKSAPRLVDACVGTPFTSGFAYAVKPQLDAETSTDHHPVLVDSFVQTVKQSTFHGLATRDAFTDTVDLPSTHSEVMTTVTTRKYDAKAAAAFFQHLTMTEQSTVVTVRQPERPHSSPNTLSQPLELNNEDTGIELSRGLTQSESGVLNETQFNMSSLHLPTTMELIANVKSQENLETSSNTEVLVDLNSPHNQCSQTLYATMLDAACGTEDLKLEVISSTDLNELMEHQASSNLMISTMRNEINEMHKYQEDLQTDCNLLQEMLDSRETELERYASELVETQTRCVNLEKQIAERKNVLVERDEDVFLLTEENEKLRDRIQQLEQTLVVSTNSVDVDVQTDRGGVHVANAATDTEDHCQFKDAQTSCFVDTVSCSVQHEIPASTSTPVKVSSMEPDDLLVAEELETLMAHLRDESAKLTSLSGDDSPPSTGAYLNSSLSMQPSAIEDLVRANTALKNTVNELSQVLEGYENPVNTQCSTQTANEHIHQLIRSVSKTLCSDEIVWLNALQTSIAQGAVMNAMDDSVHHPGTLPKISRIVDQLTSFIKQEHKYRECLMQLHLAERQCLDTELKSAITRSENLAMELARFSERLSSHKEALDRADTLNLRLTNQVNDLKSDVSRVNLDLELERAESGHKQARIDQLSVQLTQEHQKSVSLEQQSEQLKAELRRLDAELANAFKELTETQDALRKMTSRAEQAERDAEVFKSLDRSIGPGSTPPSQLTGSKSAQCTPPQHNEEIFGVLNSLSSTLASARKSADKAERHASELQSVNHDLRLRLAETELRFMPLLASLSPNTFSPYSPHGKSCSHQTTPPSSKLTELKGMCARLLSMTSADDLDENADTDSSTASEDETPMLGRDKLANAAGSVTRSASQLYEHAARDLKQLQAEVIARTGIRPAESNHFRSKNIANATVDPSNEPPNATASDQAVSMERFRSLHTRCLRAEGHRRALSFQKRYLVLLLGGFRCTEESVIASLGRPEPLLTMDQSSMSTVDSGDGYPRCSYSTPIRRFRTAARVAQVISRMHRLVNRWKRIDSAYLQAHQHPRAPVSSAGPQMASSRVPLRELPTETPLNRRSLPANPLTYTSASRRTPDKSASVSTDVVYSSERHRLPKSHYAGKRDPQTSPPREPSRLTDLYTTYKSRYSVTRNTSVDLYSGRAARTDPTSNGLRSPSQSDVKSQHPKTRSPPKTAIPFSSNPQSRNRQTSPRSGSSRRQVPFR